MKSGIFVRSLIDFLRSMASITRQPQFKRGIGVGELFSANAEAFRLPAKAIARFKIIFTVIQSLCRGGFSKVRVLQWKQQVVGIAVLSDSDHGISPQRSAVAIDLGRPVANVWRAILSRIAAKCPISAFCLLEQQPVTGDRTN
ncbi:hypothetical protein [Brucella intermedia]|uniref:hypothetical protein n=1 Tax=Brucella intermedia TaxID=94625 RepID=UPI00224B6AB3|nr:hypothetical protein [Brucella intermedia]